MVVSFNGGGNWSTQRKPCLNLDITMIDSCHLQYMSITDSKEYDFLNIFHLAIYFQFFACLKGSNYTWNLDSPPHKDNTSQIQ